MKLHKNQKEVIIKEETKPGIFYILVQGGNKRWTEEYNRAHLIEASSDSIIEYFTNMIKDFNAYRKKGEKVRKLINVYKKVIIEKAVKI